MVIFIIFAPPHYPSRVKGYSKLLLCEAPKWLVDPVHFLRLAIKTMEHWPFLVIFMLLFIAKTGICLVSEHSNERCLNLSCYYTVANRWRVFLFALFGLVFGVFASTKFGRSLLKKYPEFFSAGLFKVCWSLSPIQSPLPYPYVHRLNYVIYNWKNP